MEGKCEAKLVQHPKNIKDENNYRSGRSSKVLKTSERPNKTPKWEAKGKSDKSVEASNKPWRIVTFADGSFTRCQEGISKKGVKFTINLLGDKIPEGYSWHTFEEKERFSIHTSKEFRHNLGKTKLEGSGRTWGRIANPFNQVEYILLVPADKTGRKLSDIWAYYNLVNQKGDYYKVLDIHGDTQVHWIPDDGEICELNLSMDKDEVFGPEELKPRVVRETQ